MKAAIFGLARRYDEGVKPSIAINATGKICEVHESQHKNRMWYRVGQRSQMDVSWSSNHDYDSGVQPSVALNDRGTVVEVHKSPGLARLWYFVGELQGDSVKWGSSHQYDSGVTPAVALDNAGWCVEVHEAESLSQSLWYHVGQVDESKKTIQWGSSHKYDSGTSPKVAMNNRGIVIEVHKSQGVDNLWYRVGVLDKGGKTITWGARHEYDKGQEPSVAITDDGLVIEVHRGLDGAPLYCLTGTVSVLKKTVLWLSRELFDKGTNPSVSCALNGSLAIQVHDHSASQLFFSTTLLIDRKRWMEELYPRIQSRPLWKISLPGSHDAGAYEMSTDLSPCSDLPSLVTGSMARSYSETQNLSLGDQLGYGARYFDLRPCVKDGKFFAHHTNVGASFDSMLDQTASFLRETSRELVILRISHFCEFKEDPGRHPALIQLISGKLNPYLFKDTTVDLAKTQFQTFVGNGSKAIVWYDNDYIKEHPQPGFWRHLPLYDEYSNTEDFSRMEADQLQKMKAHSGSESHLFLLSWTLTLTFKSWTSALYGSLYTLTKKANPHLGHFLAKNASGYQINVLYVDFLRDARVTDCAILLNS